MNFLSLCTYFVPVSARERMIGWYHSGPKLRASDLEINEVFKRFMPRPVMVIVDVRPQTVGIPTDAYFAVEEIKDVRLFSPLRLRNFPERSLTTSFVNPPCCQLHPSLLCQ
jgi:hypothetical protein